MKYILFYFILLQRAINLFYCNHPYNCNIFMQDLQVGGSPAVYHIVACCYTKAINVAC